MVLPLFCGLAIEMECKLVLLRKQNYKEKHPETDRPLTFTALPFQEVAGIVLCASVCGFKNRSYCHPISRFIRCMPEIVISLKVQPQFRSRIKRSGQPQGNIRCHGATFVQYFGYCFSRQSQILREICNADS